jgi:hypothetical protein
MKPLLPCLYTVLRYVLYKFYASDSDWSGVGISLDGRQRDFECSDSQVATEILE